MEKIYNIQVRAYSRQLKTGVKVSVSPHTRQLKKEVVKVSKKEYEARAKLRPVKDLKKDYMRTKKGAYKGSTNELPKNWSTKKHDWIGVDAMTPQEQARHHHKTLKNPLGHKKSTHYDDATYDKTAFHDSSLTKHENKMLEKERLTFRGMSHLW